MGETGRPGPSIFHQSAAPADCFKVMEFVIRPLTSADEPLLWKMLYEGLRTAEDDVGLAPDLVRRPELARHVEGWGRSGDVGFVAWDAENEDAVGAVWFRVPLGDARPELAFAVKPSHRRRGIGAALLTQWVRANPQQSVISLGVAASNPAVRLYERFGFKVVQENANSVTMRREA
jgi:ribosomal protein S18 acetylase RimI-like enzyme